MRVEEQGRGGREKEAELTSSRKGNYCLEHSCLPPRPIHVRGLEPECERGMLALRSLSATIDRRSGLGRSGGVALHAAGATVMRLLLHREGVMMCARDARSLLSILRAVFWRNSPVSIFLTWVASEDCCRLLGACYYVHSNLQQSFLILIQLINVPQET